MQSENAASPSNTEPSAAGKPLISVDQQTKARVTHPTFPRYQQIPPPYHVMRIPAMGAHAQQQLLSSISHGISQVSARLPPHHMWGPRGPMLAPFNRTMPQTMAPSFDHHHSMIPCLTQSSSSLHRAPNLISAVEAKISTVSIVTPGANISSHGTPNKDQDGQANVANRNPSTKKLGVKWTPDEVCFVFLLSAI